MKADYHKACATKPIRVIDDTGIVVLGEYSIADAQDFAASLAAAIFVAERDRK